MNKKFLTDFIGRLLLKPDRVCPVHLRRGAGSDPACQILQPKGVGQLLAWGLLCVCMMSMNETVFATSTESELQEVDDDIPSLQQSILRTSSQPVFNVAREFTLALCDAVRHQGLTDFTIELPVSWQTDSQTDNPSDLQPAVENVERRGQTVGQRYYWQTSLTDRVIASVFGTQQRPVIVLQLGEAHPVLQLTTRDCNAVRARRIDYRPIAASERTTDNLSTVSAFQLIELDEQGAITAEAALLNPDVPDASAPELSSQATDSLRESDNRQTLLKVPVALIDSGVNYLLPEINAGLLRDESGQLIGYDYWDDDQRPFDLHLRGSPFNIQRHGTKTASLLLAEAPNARIAPFRFPRPHMHRMRELVAHIASADIRLVGMALGGNRAEEWQVFEQAASEHPDILFVVSAGNNGRNIDREPVYPAALLLDNIIVVSSADDSTLPAPGSNWGRLHVDYLLPAEHINALDFDGTETRVSGSSYAVSRMLAVLVRLQQQHPQWQIEDLKSELRRRFNDGARAQYIGGGYIGDPLSVASPQPLLEEISRRSGTQMLQTDAGDTDMPRLLLDYEIVVLDSRWDDARIEAIHKEVAKVLLQCNVGIGEWSERRLDAAPHLATMSVGGARTLRVQLEPAKPTIYLATSTRTLFEQTGEAYKFDAEAFGRANTRGRDWLRDTVWISENVQDVGLAVAHELVHVLMNDGSHVDEENNLMNTTTALHNRLLNPQQCSAVHENGLRHGLLQAVANEQ